MLEKGHELSHAMLQGAENWKPECDGHTVITVTVAELVCPSHLPSHYVSSVDGYGAKQALKVRDGRKCKADVH